MFYLALTGEYLLACFLRGFQADCCTDPKQWTVHAVTTSVQQAKLYVSDEAVFTLKATHSDLYSLRLYRAVILTAETGKDIYVYASGRLNAYSRCIMGTHEVMFYPPFTL